MPAAERFYSAQAALQVARPDCARGRPRLQAAGPIPSKSPWHASCITARKS